MTVKDKKEPGTLYIIGTPIGNMEDITLRALRILSEKADAVFCEDTRQTRKLLNAHGISIPAYSLHEHTSIAKINDTVKRLEQGASFAYVTDCGTPAVSDPGSRLVNEARSRGIAVSPVPGPSALSAIVSVCGFPEKNILFSGFLSKKEGKRKNELKRLGLFRGIIVIYESPHRIRKCLKNICEIFPDSDILIGREMTKIHEEFISGTGREIESIIESVIEKGEFTIAIMNKPARNILNTIIE